MTIRISRNARQWLKCAALALLIGATVETATAEASRLGAIGEPFVYPRAGVSSDAYRTPPQLLSPRSAQPLMARRHVSREPVRLAQAPSARPMPGTTDVVPTAHRDVQQVNSRRENRQSVMNELQQLYEDEGRPMPQMQVPDYQQPQVQPGPQAGRPISGNAAPPITQAEPTRKSGLFAGLFDFARRNRDNRNRDRNMPTQPPAEPQPFRPPTYRQEPQQFSQTPARQMPRTAQAPAGQVQQSQPQQQATAQSKQSKAAVGLKRTTPDRNFATADDVFFPGQNAEMPAILPEGRSAKRPQVAVQPQNAAEVDSLSGYFPDDVPEDADIAKAGTTPAIDAAVDTLKVKTNQHLDGPDAQTAIAGTDSDGFSTPTLIAEDEIIPQPAPAAVSEFVTTNVAPESPGEGPVEPAPFFANGERAIDPDEEMEVAALDGQTFDPSGADSQETSGSVTDSPDAGSLMQQIAAREGVGLKGFCCVALHDERRLADGRAAYVSFYRGKAYYFSSAEAKATFDDNPAQYVPAAGGEDVAMKTLTGEVVEGSLDHSVWYKGKLYLFQSAETLKTFTAAPSAMAVMD